MSKRFLPLPTFVGTITLSLCLAFPSTAATLTTNSHEFSWLPWLCNSYIRQAKAGTDIQKLKDYEVILIIDKSHSMLVEDCLPPHSTAAANDIPISRWQWCRREILDIARQAIGTLPQHFRVVTFSDDYSIYDHVDPPGVDMIFAENTPSGPTHATRALKSQLDEYFARRATVGTEAKPLLIAMITDGCPEKPESLKWEIENAAKHMLYPDEIKITVLQVGHDERAQRLIADPNGLGQQDSKYDIVQTQSFEQLQQTGLVKALAEAVTPRSAVKPQGGDLSLNPASSF